MTNQNSTGNGDSALERRLSDRSTPKRLLSLDGGRIRGVVTLAFLQRIEEILRKQHGDAYRLSEHFHLIGGTSTGSIIAAALACGHEVAWIQEKYDLLSKSVFTRDDGGLLGWLKNRMGGVFCPKFDSVALENHLEHLFPHKLGSDAIKTGLMIMIRRVDSASAWPIHNNPAGKYYMGPAEDSREQWVANKELPLDRLILASAAAPSYFEPQELIVGQLPNGREEVGLFVDGGISPHNNPALQLLRLATLSGYCFKWPMGAESMQLVSVGTGATKTICNRSFIEAKFAIDCLKGLMDDCADEVELMLQWMSNSRTARSIDGEVGNLSNDLLGGEPLLSYHRYNIVLDGFWLSELMGRQLKPQEVERLREMDRPESLKLLKEIGRTAAARLVKEEDII